MKPEEPAATLPATGANASLERRRKWRMFGLGLAVRLLGVALIFVGDGSPAWWRKALVIIGVVLSIGGIAVLRYLLVTGLRKKK